MLEVQITGLCVENLHITRNDVTLRGMDAAAGFQGVGADPGGDHSVIRVQGSSRIRIETLRVIDGSRFGLTVQSSYGVNLVVTLQDTDQVSDPAGETVVDMDSSLELTGTASLIGPVSLFNFSKAMINNNASIGGSLACYSASDAWCSDPNDVGGTTSDCEHCDKP